MSVEIGAPGGGFPPVEESDDHLRGFAENIGAELAALERRMKCLRDQRANWIDPRLEQRWQALRAEGSRLTRRMRWLENWPERHRRQLARYDERTGSPYRQL